MSTNSHPKQEKKPASDAKTKPKKPKKPRSHSKKQDHLRVESAPSASSAVTRGTEPTIYHRGDRTVVSHSEYVCDVVAPVVAAGALGSDFNLLALSAGDPADRTSGFVNPGNPALFRWLSALASRYEGYQFKKLKFRYEPRCSTGTAGEVLISMDMDCDDSSPNSKAQMYDWKHRVGGAAWQRLEFSVPTRDQTILSRRLFVSQTYENGNPNAGGFDPRTCHMGVFYLALNAMTTAGLLGDLFVDYEVEFFVVQLDETSSVVGSVSKYTPVGPSAARPFGTGAPTTITDGSRFARPVTDASYNLWEVVKPGVYQVVSQFLGTGLGAATLAAVNSTGLTYSDAEVDQAATTDKMSIWTLNCVEAPMLVRIYLTAATTLTFASLWISKLPFLAMPGATLTGNAYSPVAPTLRIDPAKWLVPRPVKPTQPEPHTFHERCHCNVCARVRDVLRGCRGATDSPSKPMPPLQ